MPNTFSGQLFYSDGTPVPDAQVKLTVSGSLFTKEVTTTDKNGRWNASLEKDVNPKDVTILFSKSGYKSKKVTNPLPTEILEEFIDPKKGGTLKLQSLFESGKWKVTSLSGEDKAILDHELEDLFQFIKSKPQNVQIKVISSESQVPNADNENAGKDFSKPGSLAKERGLTLRKYIEDVINQKIEDDNGIQNKENYRPIFNYTEEDITRIGNESWEEDNPQVQAANDLLRQQEGVSKSADLSKYKKDQYVAIEVTLINQEKDCYANILIDIFYDETGHVCNQATFRLYANDVLLKRDDGKTYVSLNNSYPETDFINKTKFVLDEQRENLRKEQSKPTPDKNLINFLKYEIFKNENLLRGIELDNIHTGYNKPSYGLKLEGSRFEQFEENEIFPLTNTTPPTVRSRGSEEISVQRYNRIQIDTTVANQIKQPGKSVITLSIKCDNISGVSSTKWGTGCHEGIAKIQIYKLSPNSEIIYKTDIEKFTSPKDQNQKFAIFDFDPCTGIITNKTKEAFPNSNPSSPSDPSIPTN